ncbi:DNA adenine methylase [Empedobacter tilapiae]|uniref:DNA adenine methylase n=1 Tax=Empedobacter tilapiae TaxID=2491114 RepID=UPI0028D6E099|nr:DNA adenine methylase [Empedobacter tilapiae]
MILTRFGNKRKIIEKIHPYFPKHNMRIELFFGAGGSFFYLPKPKYSILNDLDNDVTNLYLVLKNQKEEFLNEIKILPISEGLIKYWKENKETDPLKKAVRFIFLSNFTYLGKGDTLRVGLDNAKNILIKNIEPTFHYLENAKILNRDFREVLSTISFTKGLNDKEKCFIYLDPVYLDTECNYKVPNWTEKDSIDCLEIMLNSGIKSAMSEFNHPTIIEEAKKRGFNIINIGERSNIKNRQIEILITNYENNQLQLTL